MFFSSSSNHHHHRFILQYKKYVGFQIKCLSEWILSVMWIIQLNHQKKLVQKNSWVKSQLLQIDLFCFTLSFIRIDHKVSSASHGYKLQEAQAILKEVKTIKDAISSGEKEKKELMQVKMKLNLFEP